MSIKQRILLIQLKIHPAAAWCVAVPVLAGWLVAFGLLVGIAYGRSAVPDESVPSLLLTVACLIPVSLTLFLAAASVIIVHGEKRTALWFLAREANVAAGC